MFVGLVRAVAAVCSLMMLLSSQAASQDSTALKTFPEAEGWGAGSRGGSGGRVIKVTNLSSSGPGSLAAACRADGPRK